jgi:WhiB family redox-sensing transcriptional regulator
MIEIVTSITGAPGRPDWTADAQCRGQDSELWYPQRGEVPRHAIAVCGRCPVAQQCLDYALDHNEGFGIWAGTTARERRRIRKTRHAANPTLKGALTA